MRAAKFLMATTAAVLCATEARADLVISNKATRHVSCSNGTCISTAATATLNAGDLASLLASGDVTVKTGGGATNIVVKAGVNWTSTSRLTLDANQSVEIDRPVSVTGSGAVTITTNDGGTGGDLMFDGKGNVKFWDTASSLVINGNSYTLVKDIATLASDIAASPSGFYALASDYDASVDGTYSSAPITTTFGGTLEGLGHAISHLQISSSNFQVGLFAEAGGALRDLSLAEAIVVGADGAGDVGTLIGESDSALVIGCQATGAVSVSNGSAGGLVGVSRSTFDGSIVRSHSSASISGGDGAAVGGLVGLSGFFISLSYATGQVVAGSSSFVGGLVGREDGGGISQSFASGSASGGSSANVGGLVGSGGTQVDNSYAIGAIEGPSSAIVGGFAGNSTNMRFTSSYSAGRVRGETAGGFLGERNGDSFETNYWDVDASGKGKRRGCGGGHCPQGIKGLKTSEFQTGLPTGFDPAIWGEKQNVNNGLPFLRAIPLN